MFVEHIVNENSSDFEDDECYGFRMNVKETHKTAMERQITEAVKIEMKERNGTEQVLNRKTGYRVNRVLRLRSSLSSD